MSQVQIVFTTDQALKKATAAKLKKEGNTFKSLFQYTMMAYIQGKISLWLITDQDTWTPELEQEYQKNMKDYQEWKNITAFEDLVKI